MTEVEFSHYASRTLVLTDLIENFERQRIDSWMMRMLVRLGGVMDPNGSMPRDVRVTFRRRKREMKRAIETMISWDPKCIIVAHGRWYDRDGANELRRTLRWLLEQLSCKLHVATTTFERAKKPCPYSRSRVPSAASSARRYSNETPFMRSLG